MSTDEGLAYRCVDCGAPAASLYKAYSKTSVKLTSCVHCNRNVDPYVERDWVLVVLDCVLLRLPAYRHVLWNNGFGIMTARKGVFYLWAASLLHTYLNRDAIKAEGYETTETTFVMLFFYSIVSLSMQVVTTYFGIKYANSKPEKKITSEFQVCLGLLLPLSFSVVTLLILVWENTRTVHLLGKCFGTMFQFTAIQVIAGGACTFLVGMIVRMFACVIVARLCHLPCLGLALREQICLAL
jgi:Arv1-like family